MQGTPSVPAPRDTRRRNWYPYLGALALILALVLLVVLASQPQLLVRDTTATVYENPELSVFRRYVAEHDPATTASSLADNPELAVFRRYAAQQDAAITAPSLADNPELAAFRRYQNRPPSAPFLEDNPEVRQFLMWQDRQ